MPSYLVSWQIEVDADTPRDAAIAARDLMPTGDNNSTATFFDVLDQEQQLTELIDLSINPFRQ